MLNYKRAAHYEKVVFTEITWDGFEMYTVVLAASGSICSSQFVVHWFCAILGETCLCRPLVSQFLLLNDVSVDPGATVSRGM